MNRSHRRGLAVSWSAAIGAAWAGLGVVGAVGAVGVVSTGTAPPAMADDGAAERGGNEIEDGRGARDAKATAKIPSQRRTRTPDTGTGGSAGLPPGTGGSEAQEHCSWPNWPPVIYPVSTRDGDGRELPVSPTQAPPQFLAGPLALGPVAERSSTALISMTRAPVAQTFTAPLAGSRTSSPPPSAPSPSPPPQSQPQAQPAPVSGPATGIPKSSAAQELPVRLGYPSYLQSASVQEVAVLALIGAAGLAALTGAGGFVGYRQAKAGFALRAGGTARFLP